MQLSFWEFTKQSRSLISRNIIIRRLLSAEALQMEALWCSSLKQLNLISRDPVMNVAPRRDQNCIFKASSSASVRQLAKLPKATMDFNYLSLDKNWLISAIGKHGGEKLSFVTFSSFSAREIKVTLNVPFVTMTYFVTPSVLMPF